MQNDYAFKLFEFNVYNEKDSEHSSDEDSEEYVQPKDKSRFVIQMFGMNEQGKTCSIIVEDYQPFFYVKVDNHWTENTKKSFVHHLKSKVGRYYEDTIIDCKFVERKKLYGFDSGKLYKFVMIQFTNVTGYNKVKNLWYVDGVDEEGGRERKLIKDGYPFNGSKLELYEANIPPLLRFFHIQEISPSGWISLPKNNVIEVSNSSKKTTCDYEFIANYKQIIHLNDKEIRVPYKIMSFDIEASSSHGDFPVPIKSYKKLATNIVDCFKKMNTEMRADICKPLLYKMIETAFGYASMEHIELVYPKYMPNKEQIKEMTDKWIKTKVRDRVKTTDEDYLIESMFESANKELMVVEKKADTNNAKTEDKDEDGSDDGSDDDGSDGEMQVEEDVAPVFHRNVKRDISCKNKESTIVDILCDTNFEREGKINELIVSLKNNFPPLEGDKVTFIGSTFLRYGEKEPYLNHCIALNSCDSIHEQVANSQIESYQSEKDVLLAWTNLIQRENPDIVIGYNIFSFDYEFMFRRSQELNCVEDFLKLSRNKDELCATQDYKTNKIEIDKSSITLASGTYDLSIVKMNGRLQVDMLNWFRRTENLTSYKLDYVAGHFIGDDVKVLEQRRDDIKSVDVTRVKTTNMTGLLVDSYIHFEEINHSSDYYKEGAKFKVTQVNKEEGWFEIAGHENPKAKKVKWGLAKDDVTPKDIFRMTNEGPASRAVIAKYCIQDCNLVHYLFTKVDVVTDLVEMSKLCSVPMSFLIFRGQGIKLTSYVAKKCREKGVLMPVINKGSKNDGYEGAIVLEPKCGLYLDMPISVGDFASLYPSSMLSENLCPSSKVWVKEYDLAGNLLYEHGEKDKDGKFIYDNLAEYEYVDIRFDTYRYIRKNPKARAEKIKVGFKMCRFAQFKEGKAIMPSILEELLKARKDTRKQIPLQSDEFIKNILDKRQLAYKVTANSLYGQLGAKTSTFYEPDIAASTTATGRLLLTYAKRVVEECYGDAVVETKYGLINTKAEYVYGDSVANYTPIYVKVNDKINILTIEDLAIKYGNNLWVKCKEEGKQDKEFCELVNVDTWSEKGWTKLHRVIRHELVPHKKMVRVLTHTGCVDVTDDHSLVKKDGTEVSPKDIQVGMELLHKKLTQSPMNNFNHPENDIFSLQFDNMLQAAQYINYLNSIDYNAYCISSYNNYPSIVISTGLIHENPIAIKKISHIDYSGYVYDLTTENHHFAAGVGNMIVHNTDSVFFTFNLSDKESGQPILGEKALELSIEIAQEATHNVSKFLKQPHDFEYEKTFLPFCLLSKKRYVGILYETDPKKGKRKEMGIVLKRRDNAPIVKDIYGGVIDILMKERDVQKAMDYVNKCLQELVDGKVPMEKLIITKSLNSFYKNPNQIAHKVLADRIAQRDPGNKPTSGDRIPFVYIINSNKNALQGEKIETPSYIIENKIPIDYSFYITNQIMKPLLQLFSLVLENIWKMQNKTSKISKFKREIEEVKKTIEDPKKCDEKIEKMRNKEVQILIFDKYLRETNNVKDKNQVMTKFFKSK